MADILEEDPCLMNILICMRNTEKLIYVINISSFEKNKKITVSYNCPQLRQLLLCQLFREKVTCPSLMSS